VRFDPPAEGVKCLLPWGKATMGGRCSFSNGDRSNPCTSSPSHDSHPSPPTFSPHARKGPHPNVL
jgi:hypothetical protein